MPGGLRIVAVDLDTRFLDHLDEPNLDVARMDLRTELHRRGLRDVWADCEAPLFEGGSVGSGFWRLTVAQARDLVVTEGISPQRLDEWDRQLGEPGRWFPSMAIVASCGRRDD